MIRLKTALVSTREWSLLSLFGAGLIAALITISDTAAAQEGLSESKRVSEMRQGLLTQRGRGEISETTRNEYPALQLSRKQPGDVGASAPSKMSAQSTSSANIDFWFYSADVELYFDHDGDGYYYGIDLWFDVDTVFDAVDVYAVVYLSFEGGPWNEFAATDDFTIFGASSDDDYVIETDLISGYPTGSYDMLIELFDPIDGAFLASIGPDDTSELAFLPLEDSDRDAPIVFVQPFRGHGGGGATGQLMLLALALIACGVRRTRSSLRAAR